MKKKKCIFIISILLIILLLLLGLKLSFKLEIIGNDNIIMNYNDKYEEKGVKFSLFGKDLSNKVQITSDLKEGKTGKYNVKYNAKIGIFNFSKIKKVEIKDDKEPDIELSGDKIINICPNTKYQEDGYKAYDEYDGDLTDKVKVSKKDNNIIYSVKDNSGNLKEVIRKIKYFDKEKPVIDLKGNSTIYLPVNEKYKEQGYTVKDNCSSNLEKEVKVINNIDITKPGKYEIVYKVKDKMGNETSSIRTIHVYDPKNYTSSNIRGIIYLTFDDGPSGSGSTSKILDILKDEGIKATFFVTGSGPDSLIKRAYQEGHTIALHTYTHKFHEIYSSTDSFFKDIKKLESRIFNLTGEKPKILRFAGGTSNTISRHYKTGIMKELLVKTKGQGYKIFDWNVDSNDAGVCAKKNIRNKKECVYNNVTRNLSKSRKNYVLMHDIKSYTADALRDIIRYGKSRGFIFEQITESTPSYNFRPNN